MPASSKPASDVNLDDYTFERDGVMYTIPSFGSCPAGVVRKSRHLDDADAMFTILEAIVPEGPALDAIDAMVGPEFSEFMEAWQRAAGVDLPN